MTIETEADIDGLKRIGQIVARCMAHMAAHLEPGMTTAELDAVGAVFLESHGAVSAPQATYDFPGATCISVNEEVAHGVPGRRVIRKGDLVNIDVSASLGGYFGDTGGSFVVGRPSGLERRLCAAGRKALAQAVDRVRAGKPLREVGRAAEKVATREGFEVIRNLGSHGVGRALHEEPSFIPGFDDRSERRRFGHGMVVTVEPFLTNGDAFVTEADDGFTLLNRPGSRTVQFEHTVIATSGRPIVTTLP